MSLQDLQKKPLALCIDPGEYDGVSLFAMKIYEYIPDEKSENEGFLNIVDEEGESYFYDANGFLKIVPEQRGLLIPLSSPA